jgi:hypothetical protein
MGVAAPGRSANKNIMPTTEHLLHYIDATKEHIKHIQT